MPLSALSSEVLPAAAGGSSCEQTAEPAGLQQACPAPVSRPSRAALPCRAEHGASEAAARREDQRGAQQALATGPRVERLPAGEKPACSPAPEGPIMAVVRAARSRPVTPCRRKHQQAGAQLIPHNLKCCALAGMARVLALPGVCARMIQVEHYRLVAQRSKQAPIGHPCPAPPAHTRLQNHLAARPQPQAQPPKLHLQQRPPGRPAAASRTAAAGPAGPQRRREARLPLWAQQAAVEGVGRGRLGVGHPAAGPAESVAARQGARST